MDRVDRVILLPAHLRNAQMPRLHPLPWYTACGKFTSWSTDPFQYLHPRPSAPTQSGCPSDVPQVVGLQLVQRRPV